MIPATTPRTVITVDGLAGSGKTSLSRALARSIGFAHLNSGLLYRGVGWLCLKSGIDLDNEREVELVLKSHTVVLRGEGELLVDGIERASELTAPEVSEATSKTSRFPVVRAFLLAAQREAFPGKGLVAEGRDMGTVVFPDAPIKFFVTASVEVRVQRRLAQLQAATGTVIDEAAIRREIIERDDRDTHRAVSPTRGAPDAIGVDNSEKSMEAIVASMADKVGELCPLTPPK
jgi:cytidylate kinase